ncbi:6873_t:CDS:1, partial [Funneliformis mosseae]
KFVISGKCPVRKLEFGKFSSEMYIREVVQLLVSQFIHAQKMPLVLDPTHKANYIYNGLNILEN